jgi:hypothetical protein
MDRRIITTRPETAQWKAWNNAEENATGPKRTIPSTSRSFIPYAPQFNKVVNAVRQIKLAPGKISC